MTHFASAHFASAHFAAPHWGNGTAPAPADPSDRGAPGSKPSASRRKVTREMHPRAIILPPKTGDMSRQSDEILAITTLLALYWSYYE